jgi:hypothetical protein
MVLRGSLYRQLVKFERPKSLFGNLTYVQEQAKVRSAVDDMVKGSLNYSPKVSDIELPFIKLLPKEKRAKRVKFYFTRARNKISEVVG